MVMRVRQEGGYPFCQSVSISHQGHISDLVEDPRSLCVGLVCDQEAVVGLLLGDVKFLHVLLHEVLDGWRPASNCGISGCSVLGQFAQHAAPASS